MKYLDYSDINFKSSDFAKFASLTNAQKLQVLKDAFSDMGDKTLAEIMTIHNNFTNSCDHKKQRIVDSIIKLGL